MVIVAIHIVSVYQRHQQLCLIPSRDEDKINVKVRDGVYPQADLLMAGFGVRQELKEKIMCFRELHRAVLHHCASSEITIKYLAPLPPIISTGCGWVKPFPSHPNESSFAQTGKDGGCIHLVKWRQVTIRVDISALLEQVLGRLWGVENDYYLSENFDGHDLACGLPKSAQNVVETDMAHHISDPT
jgi:hypothetical protein